MGSSSSSMVAATSPLVYLGDRAREERREEREERELEKICSKVAGWLLKTRRKGSKLNSKRSERSESNRKTTSVDPFPEFA